MYRIKTDFVKRDKMLTFFGDCKMTKETVVKTTQETTCMDCQKKYDANRIVKPDGTIMLTPPRCEVCQTAHLTNLRVNKTIKDISLLGNLKPRLSDVERAAILEAVSGAFNVLADRYSGSTVKASAFDLKEIKTQ